MAIARIGALVRFIGMCFGRRRFDGKGIWTGTITKKIERMKTTRVAIEKPSIMLSTESSRTPWKALRPYSKEKREEMDF